MTTKSQNVEHWSGDNLIMQFTVTDATGGIVDLTGASAKWWLGKTATSRLDSNVLIKKTSSDIQQIWFDQVNSFWRVNVKLLPADTENITPNPAYYHECQVVDATGVVSTVSVGKFKLNPTIIPDP